MTQNLKIFTSKTAILGSKIHNRFISTKLRDRPHHEYFAGMHLGDKSIPPPKKVYQPKQLPWADLQRCNDFGYCDEAHRPERLDEVIFKKFGPKKWKKLPAVFPYPPRKRDA